MATTFCPHLFGAYLSKASQIIDIYEPQIVSIVRYDSISRKLLHRKVLRRREHKKIFVLSEPGKMGNVLQILKLRMWGLENLITILIEENIDNWLAEELFQAYIRHLVANMQKLQNDKLCDCIKTGNLTLLQCSWFVMLERLDAWLVDIGTSLGCLAAPLHPIKNLLGFIRQRLNLRSRKETLKSVSSLPLSSESEGSECDEEQKHEAVSMPVFRERSVSTPSLSKKPLSLNINEIDFEEIVESRTMSAREQLQKIASKNVGSESCPDMIQDLEWDEEDNVPEFYSTFNLDKDYILELIGRGSCTSCSSFSSTYSDIGHRSTTGEMASQTDLLDIPFSKVSISTQTTPRQSPTTAEAMTCFDFDMSKSVQRKELPKSPVKRNLTGKTPTVGTVPKPKVASVRPLPRRKVDESKSRNPVSPNQPIYKDRLRPEDYGNWSSAHLSRVWTNEMQRSAQGGTNVA